MCGWKISRPLLFSSPSWRMYSVAILKLLQQQTPQTLSTLSIFCKSFVETLESFSSQFFWGSYESNTFVCSVFECFDVINLIVANAGITRWWWRRKRPGKQEDDLDLRRWCYAPRLLSGCGRMCRPSSDISVLIPHRPSTLLLIPSSHNNDLHPRLSWVVVSCNIYLHMSLLSN